MILVIGGAAKPAGKAWTTPCLPKSRASPLPSKIGSLKSGLSSAKIWVTKTVGIVPEPGFVIAIAVGLPPTCTTAFGIGFNGLPLGILRMETVPSVWFATYSSAPSGVNAQPRGSVPTGIWRTSLNSVRSTTETVPVMPLVTYAAWSVGWTATQRGS